VQTARTEPNDRFYGARMRHPSGTNCPRHHAVVIADACVRCVDCGGLWRKEEMDWIDGDRWVCADQRLCNWTRTDPLNRHSPLQKAN
jgi:hypothetical protein